MTISAIQLIWLLVITIILSIGASIWIEGKYKKYVHSQEAEEKVPETKDSNLLTSYSFLNTAFEDYSIRRNSFNKKKVSITFSLKVGGIYINKELEADSFQNLMVKLRNWYEINNTKLEFINENLEDIN